jgi:hypothetical protein
VALAARGKYHFLILTGDTEVFVYMYLFVDEFVVALQGDVNRLQPDDLAAIAGQSDLPAGEFSNRPWIRQPSKQTVDPSTLKAMFGLER